MFNYDVLLNKYRNLQKRNRTKSNLINKQKREIERLEQETIILKREIKRRNKKIREKNLIIGWLLDRGDKNV